MARSRLLCSSYIFWKFITSSVPLYLLYIVGARNSRDILGHSIKSGIAKHIELKLKCKSEVQCQIEKSLSLRGHIGPESQLC